MYLQVILNILLNINNNIDNILSIFEIYNTKNIDFSDKFTINEEYTKYLDYFEYLKQKLNTDEQNIISDIIENKDLCMTDILKLLDNLCINVNDEINNDYYDYYTFIENKYNNIKIKYNDIIINLNKYSEKFIDAIKKLQNPSKKTKNELYIVKLQNPIIFEENIKISQDSIILEEQIKYKYLKYKLKYLLYNNT